MKRSRGHEALQTAGAQRTVKSEELFRGSKEIYIEHHDDRYRLMITRSGKLILNK